MALFVPVTFFFHLIKKKGVYGDLSVPCLCPERPEEGIGLPWGWSWT